MTDDSSIRVSAVDKNIRVRSSQLTDRINIVCYHKVECKVTFTVHCCCVHSLHTSVSTTGSNNSAWITVTVPHNEEPDRGCLSHSDMKRGSATLTSFAFGFRHHTKRFQVHLMSAGSIISCNLLWLRDRNFQFMQMQRILQTQFNNLKVKMDYDRNIHVLY